MNWFAIFLMVLVGVASAGSVCAQAAPAVEPVVAAIEPVTLRTALARNLPEAKRTVIVPAREDAVLGLTHFSKEEFTAAGLDWDQFMAKATAAATRLLVSIKPVVVKDKAGQIAYIKLKSERPFTASIIYSPRMVPLFQGLLGDRLVALMPDRYTVFLFSRNFGEFQAFGQKIIDDHADSIYPCSIEAFEISRDGVKCIGGFDDGADELPADALPPEAKKAVQPELPRAAPAPKTPSVVPREPAAPAR